MKATRRSTEKREAVLHFPENQGMWKHGHFQDQLASHYSLLWNHWSVGIHSTKSVLCYMLKTFNKAIILPPLNFFRNNLVGNLGREHQQRGREGFMQWRDNHLSRYASDTVKKDLYTWCFCVTWGCDDKEIETKAKKSSTTSQREAQKEIANLKEK